MKISTIVAIILTIAVIVFGPFGAIWSLNVLFSLSIPYTLKTWAASFFLFGLIGYSTGGKK